MYIMKYNTFLPMQVLSLQYVCTVHSSSLSLERGEGATTVQLCGFYKLLEVLAIMLLPAAGLYRWYTVILLPTAGLYRYQIVAAEERLEYTT
jgi:hypothetical protein